MAREVDTRVVEMQFDNKRFEENARESMSTLEKLKQALNFDNLRNSFKNLSKSAGEVSMDGMDKSLDTVNAKFSALQVVGMTALANITNSAIEAGKKIASALTIDPMRTGFNQYESKIKSMNVLVHALASRNTEEEINQAIEGLYDYANDTIYNPQNMIDTLSKLSNADKTRDAKELSNVIKGFGNMAALAGAGANEFNRGVYNLSQAMSTGKMTAIDWKSFENANLATNELKDLFVETAVEIGELTKGTELYDLAVQDFRGSLQKGWLTSEVMLRTLSKYNDETTEFGKAAIAAGSRVKNFSELMDSLGESITTGWARTIEVVFGDMHELSDLLTVINNIVGGFLDNMAKERLDLLKSWKDLGGRDAAIDALSNSFLALYEIIRPIKQAFRDIFPKMTAERLVDLTNNIRDFTAQMRISGTTANYIYNTFSGIFTLLKIGLDIVLGFAKFALPPVAITLQVIAKVLLFLTSALGGGITAFTNWIRSVNLGAKALKVLTTVAKAALAGILLLAEGLVMVFDWLSNLPIVRTAIDLVEKAVEGIKALVAKLLELTGIKLTNIPKSFSEMLKYIKQIASTIKNSKFVTSLTTTLRTFIDFITDKMKVLGERLGVAKDGLLKFLRELKQGYKDFGPKGLFTVLVNKVKEFKEIIQNGGLFGNLFSGGSLENAKEHMHEFVEGVKEFASTLTPGRVAAFAFSVAIISMAGAINKAAVSISGIGTGIKTFFKNINATLLAMGRKSAWMQDFALMIGVLAGSLTLLTSLPNFEKLEKAAWILGALIVAVGGLTIVMEKMSMTTTKDGKVIAAKFDQLAITLLSLAVSAGVLAGALYLIQDINTTDLWKKVGALVVSMAGMALIAGVLGSRVKEFSKGSLFLLAFAGATKMVVSSLVALKDLDATSLKDNLLALAAIMLGMGVLAAGAGQIRLTSVIGIVALSTTLNYCVPVLEDIANMDISGLKSGVENTLRGFAEMVANIADTIAVFLGYESPSIGDSIRKNGLIIGLTTIAGVSAVLIKLLDKAGKAIKNAGTGFLAISGAIFLLTYTAERLKKLDMSTEQLSAATSFITRFVIFFGAYGLLMGVVAKVDKDAKSMAGQIGFSMLALTVAITSLTWLVQGMKNIKPEELQTGMLAIAGISGLLTALIYVAGKAGAVSLKSISAMIVGLAFIFGELIVLSTFKWEELAPAVGSISTILVALGVCMGLVRGFGKQAKTYVTWKSIAAMVAGLTAAVVGLAVLKGSTVADLAPTVGALIIVMAGLGTTFALMTKFAKNMTVSNLYMFVTMVGILGEVILGLAVLSYADHVISSSMAMVIGLAGVVGAMIALDRFVKDTSKITKLALSILLIAESLVVVATACTVFDEVSLAGLGKAGLALLALGVVVGLLTFVSKGLFVGKNIFLVGVAFLELAGSLVIVAQACKVFETINAGAIGAVIITLVAMTAALAALTALVSAFPAIGVAAILAVGGAFLMLGGSLALAGVGMMAGAKALEWFIPSLWQLDEMFKSGLAISLHVMAGSLKEVGLAGLILIGAGLGFLSFGAGLMVFSNGVAKLIELDMFKAVNNLTLFVSAAKSIEQAKITFTMIKTAAGVALLGAATYLFAGAMGELNKLSLRDIATNLADIWNTFDKFSFDMILKIGGTALALGLFSNVLIKMNSNSKKTNKMLSSLSENLLKLSESLEKLSKNKFIQAGEDAVTGLVQGVQNKSDNAKIAFGLLGAACLGGFSETTGWHSPWRETIRAGIDAVKGLIFGVDSAEGDAKTAFSDLGDTVVSSIGDKLETLKEGGIGEFVQGLTGNFGGLNEVLDTFGINLGGVTESLGGATDEMEEFSDSTGEATLNYEDLTEAIANSLDIFAEFDKKTELTMDQLLKNMHSQIVGVSEWADDLRILAERGIDKGLLAYLANLGPQGFEYVNAFIHGSEEQLAIASDLYRTSLTISSTAADQITSSYYDIGYESGDSTIEGYVDGVEENTEEAEQAAITASSAVLGAFRSKDGFDINSPSHKAEEIGHDVIEGLAKGIREGKGSDIKTTTISISKTIVKTLSGALSPNAFKTIGSNVSKGLTSGLNATNTTSMVLKACESLGKGILGKLRKVLGINSPSTEAIKIGEFFDEGLILGMKRYSNQILTTSEDTGNYAIQGMKDAVEKMNDISFNYIDTNPTIRPVLDISDVVNGANNINGLFGAASLSADITGKTNTLISQSMLDKFNAVAAGMNNSNDILGEMRLMRNQINELSESMSEMQMVMDTGAVVGQLAKPMDGALGTRAIRNRREKI